MAFVASLVATVVSAVFAARLVRRWVAGGRTNPAMLAWSISIVMFSVASLMLLLGVVVGWSEPSFHVFYLFGAVLNVPWLALGSVLVNARAPFTSRATGVVTLLVGLAFLPGVLRADPLAYAGAVVGIVWGLLQIEATPHRVRRGSATLLVGWSLVAAVVVLSSDLGALPTDGLPEGREVFGVWARSFAVGGNAVGSLVVIVGALVAVGNLGWQALGASRRRVVGSQVRERPVDGLAVGVLDGWRALAPAGLRDLAVGNLLIALGVVFAAGSGGMFSFLGDTTAHAVGLGVGVLIMFSGFDRTARGVNPPVAAGVSGAVPADGADATAAT